MAIAPCFILRGLFYIMILLRWSVAAHWRVSVSISVIELALCRADWCRSLCVHVDQSWANWSRRLCGLRSSV